MVKARQAEQPAEEEVKELVLASETRAMFASMVTMVPDAEGDATESIVLAILNAKTWDELDDPWDSEKATQLVDVEQRIDSIMRRPSSYTSGLGVFLVIKGKRMDTDEPIVWTSGAVSVVAQLVKAYALGAFPVYAMLRRSERPSAAGYYPQHLEITGSGGGSGKRGSSE